VRRGGWTPTTALLILDLMKTNSGERPRCTAIVPNVKKLHDAARAANRHRIGFGAVRLQGYLVPVDGTASEGPYMEQYAAWHMCKGGLAIITEHVTVTRSDMINFAN
jgi:nicotinamidase-related amidase